MWKKVLVLSLSCLILSGARKHCRAEETSGARALFVNGIRNDHPASMVRVDVDRADRTYRERQSVRCTVRSEKDGYLYLFNVRVDGKVHCLFPNKFQTDNRIFARTGIQVPAADAGFSIEVGAPFSNDQFEVIKAIVTQQPLQSLKVEELVKDVGVEVPQSIYKALYPRELKDRPEASWSEHHVEIRTLAENFRVEHRPVRRIAVVVGIGNYLDVRIRDLKVCGQDAMQFGAVLKNLCHFDEVITLTDQKATLANVEHTIRKELAERTRPGDTIIIYWSGHGGRCADDNGDEKDGFDEFIVTYDGQYTDIHSIRKTMLLDDTLGRWIQELDGRQIALILDTCHSGGQASAAKVVRSFEANSAPVEEFDFFDGEIARTKDIGQQDTVVLASSAPSQISFERREEDLSVMTYFLIELIRTSDRSVTLQDAFDYLTQRVPEYVERTFPGTTQRPIMVPRIAHELRLRYP